MKNCIAINRNLSRGRLSYICRRAFTMVELVLAAMITALVATASATVISAVSSATVITKNNRDIKNAGNYALGRIASTIRESRCVGAVASGGLTLWMRDSNSNDSVNLNETGIIRYNSAAQQIIFEYMQSSSTAVSTAQLTNPSTLSSLMTGTDKRSVVWADGVTAFAMEGYPSTTETRIVQVRFGIGTGADATVFQLTASPKGGGDYLFATSAKETPSWSSRPVRAKRSSYSGVSTTP